MLNDQSQLPACTIENENGGNDELVYGTCVRFSSLSGFQI